MGKFSEAMLGDHAAPPTYPETPGYKTDGTSREAGMGFKRYSARALIHRIRWHEQIERGNQEFKVNNNITPALARWFIARHPALANFFETRESPNG